MPAAEKGSVNYEQILLVMTFHSLKTSNARLTARPDSFLDNERPSLAIERLRELSYLSLTQILWDFPQFTVASPEFDLNSLAL